MASCCLGCWLLAQSPFNRYASKRQHSQFTKRLQAIVLYDVALGLRRFLEPLNFCFKMKVPVDSTVCHRPPPSPGPGGWVHTLHYLIAGGVAEIPPSEAHGSIRQMSRS